MAEHIVTREIPDRVVVTWKGRKVLETTHAIELKEGSYPAVLYLPRGDADMSLLARSARESTCPYKGKANYFSLSAGGDSEPDAVWTYETPKAGVESIKEHLAFYPNKVEIRREKA